MIASITYSELVLNKKESSHRLYDIKIRTYVYMILPPQAVALLWLTVLLEATVFAQNFSLSSHRFSYISRSIFLISCSCFVVFCKRQWTYKLQILDLDMNPCRQDLPTEYPFPISHIIALLAMLVNSPKDSFLRFLYGFHDFYWQSASSAKVVHFKAEKSSYIIAVLRRPSHYICWERIFLVWYGCVKLVCGLVLVP